MLRQCTVAYLTGLTILGITLQAQADPFFNMWIEGRIAGSADQYSGTVSVLPGQTVEYQVRGAMAPIGTQNVTGGVTRTILPETFTSRYTGIPGEGNGVNSLRVDVWQEPTDPIQVSLSPVTFNSDPTPAPNDGWGDGPIARGFTSVRTEGGNVHDLLGVLAMHRPGVFTALDPEVIFTGAFDVPPDATDGSATIRLRWGEGPGAIKFLDSQEHIIFVLARSKWGADPWVGFPQGYVETLITTPSDAPLFAPGLRLVAVPEPRAIVPCLVLCLHAACGRLRRNTAISA